jgi:hypothetical protein
MVLLRVAACNVLGSKCWLLARQQAEGGYTERHALLFSKAMKRVHQLGARHFMHGELPVLTNSSCPPSPHMFCCILALKPPLLPSMSPVNANHTTMVAPSLCLGRRKMPDDAAPGQVTTKLWAANIEQGVARRRWSGSSAGQQSAISSSFAFWEAVCNFFCCLLSGRRSAIAFLKLSGRQHRGCRPSRPPQVWPKCRTVRTL